jgi:hypothetical protein
MQQLTSPYVSTAFCSLQKTFTFIVSIKLPSCVLQIRTTGSCIIETLGFHQCAEHQNKAISEIKSPGTKFNIVSISPNDTGVIIKHDLWKLVVTKRMNKWQTCLDISKLLCMFLGLESLWYVAVSDSDLNS